MSEQQSEEHMVCDMCAHKWVAEPDDPRGLDCPACGSIITSYQPRWICKKCTRSNAPGSAECPQCGSLPT